MKKTSIKQMLEQLMIAHKFKEYRELAHYLDTSSQALSNWLLGRRNPSFYYSELIKRKYYEDVLKISPSALVGGQAGISEEQFA